jgi:uncharacterized integral membrane protein
VKTSLLSKIKIVVAWLAIMALGIFVVMNTHNVSLRLPFDIGLHAPLGLVLLATALLGALCASGLRTIWRWSRGKERRPAVAPPTRR